MANGPLVIDLWQSQVDALITDSNKSLDTIHQDIKTIQNALDGISAQIKSGNLTTKAEVNDAIKAAMSEVDAEIKASKPTFTNWQTAGIVLKNGAKWYSTDKDDVGKYQIFKNPTGGTCIRIHGSVANVTKQGTVAFTLPKVAWPDLGIHTSGPSTGNGFARWFIDSTNGNVVIERTSTDGGKDFDPSWWFPFDTMYWID